LPAWPGAGAHSAAETRALLSVTKLATRAFNKSNDKKHTSFKVTPSSHYNLRRVKLSFIIMATLVHDFTLNLSRITPTEIIKLPE
jgi:hypothetical protein